METGEGRCADLRASVESSNIHGHGPEVGRVSMRTINAINKGRDAKVSVAC